jgi:hypothetical protein
VRERLDHDAGASTKGYSPWSTERT